MVLRTTAYIVKRRCAIDGNITALWREPALFIPANECNTPVAPGDVDRLVSGTALFALCLMISRPWSQRRAYACVKRVDLCDATSARREPAAVWRWCPIEGNMTAL